MPSSYKPFQVVEIKFKGSRKDFYLNADNIYLEAGELVAVETATGGYDVGHVSLTGELVRMQMVKRHVKEADVVKKIYRKATPADVDKWKMAKDLEWETMHRSRKLALELNLSMKISDVDYQGDKTKATFYYTAEGRVDFRELIKKMAEAFRIRIEMRQIGMRQEASRLGGIGSCGRELCCSTWLTDFKTVSTAAARYQNLSLNTLKLAGQCGKLKCCLNYELDTYMDALKSIPDDVNILRTEKGDARLQKTDIFKKIMWFSYYGEESWIPLKIIEVKEFQKMNKEGALAPDLTQKVEEQAKPERLPDYENVVGQDSLTRLDERNRNKKKNKNRNKGNKPEQQQAGRNDQQQNRPQGGNNQNRQQGGGNQNKPSPPQQTAQSKPGISRDVKQQAQNNQPRPEGGQPREPRPEGSGNNRNRRNKNRGGQNRGGGEQQNRNNQQQPPQQ
jgi:cell fate regulator YaaT (PSP1 superfamily)